MEDTQMNKQLEKNIGKEYVFSVLNNFNLTRSIWMLYLAFKGMNLFQIGMMEAIFHITSFSMEIPTGLVADVYGRKVSRLIGRLLNIISLLLLIIGKEVGMIALSFVVSALSYNLESGAGDALLYDSMKEIGREEEYSCVIGKREIFFQISATVSMLLAGYLAKTDYLLVYKVATGIGVLTLIQAFSFTEPSLGRVQTEQGGLKLLGLQFKESMGIIKGNRSLRILILFSEIFALCYTTEFFYIQNYLKGQGKTELYISMILAIGALLSALAASQTHKFIKSLGTSKLLSAASLLAIGGFWWVALFKGEGIAFIGISLIEGIIFVTTSQMINERIPSEQRATLLSFQSMFFSSLMIVVFPMIGKMGDYFGLKRAFGLLAVIAMVALTAIFVKAGVRTKDEALPLE